jgi:hypothetical protein
MDHHSGGLNSGAGSLQLWTRYIMHTYQFTVIYDNTHRFSVKKFTLKVASNMAGRKHKLLDTFEIIYNIESLEKKLGKITDILIHEVTYKEVCEFPSLPK